MKYNDRTNETSRFFDDLAAEYAESFVSNKLAEWARRQATTIYDKWLHSCGSVIDIGCGAGLDTVYLANKGKTVMAIDISNKMIFETQKAILEHNLQSMATAMCCDLFAENVSFAEKFDGALLGFGVANCMGDLSQIYNRCSDYIKDDGILIISALGRWCVWDTLLKLAHCNTKFRWSKRPLTVSNGNSIMNIWYWSLEDLVSAAGSDWTVLASYGVGSLVPPPYTSDFFENKTRLMNFLFKMDERIATKKIAVSSSDMIWLILKKKTNSNQ